MTINYILPDGSFHQFQSEYRFIPQKGDTVYFDVRYHVTLTEYMHKKDIQKPNYYELTEINIHLEESDNLLC